MVIATTKAIFTTGRLIAGNSTANLAQANLPRICGCKIHAGCADMSAMREKDQADFDLERFIDMFDEALTSKDPRVIDALRGLMMITALTRPEANNPLADRNAGPLRRLYEDLHTLNRRMHSMEDEIRSIGRRYKEDVFHEEEMAKIKASQISRSIDEDILRRFHHEAPSVYTRIKKGLS